MTLTILDDTGNYREIDTATASADDESEMVMIRHGAAVVFRPEPTGTVADEKPATKSCAWTEDADGNWNTGCQEIHVIISGTPQENGYVYCPYCGGQIRLTGGQSGQ